MGVHLTLVCHGSTTAVREAAFPDDEPLDTHGQAKAARLAATLRRVDAARTSPALRTLQTSQALQLDASIDPALRDIDLGRWRGRSFAEVGESEPHAIAEWTMRSDAAPHGGESVEVLLERVSGWLAGLPKADMRIVAVTHPAIIRAAIVVGVGANPMSFWRFDIAPLCMVRLQASASHWTLQFIRPWEPEP